MSLLLDIDVTRPDFAANLSFARKLTSDRLTALAGGEPYAFYAFQSDEAPLVGSYNEGTSGFLGNMAWTNIGLRTAAGWYQNYGRMRQAGHQGFGMVNNGGTSGFVGSVVGHSGNSVGGAEYFSLVLKFIATSAGEGGVGTLIYKENAYRLRFSAANTLIFEVWDGAAWRGSDTGATISYGYMHDLVIKYDGTLAAADRIKLFLHGRDVTVPGANIPTALVDDLGAIFYVLDNDTNNAAWNGVLSALATMPNTLLTLSDAQSFIEINGASQITAGDQPNILPGGMWGRPEYNFVLAEEDHLFAYQTYPLMTTTGSLMVAFTPEDMTNQQNLFGVSEDGNAVWTSLGIQIRGDIANDPIELLGMGGGVTDLRLSIPFGAARLNVPSIVWFTSDGTTVRGYLDGREQVVTTVLGANTGQWWASYPASTVFNIGAERHALIENEYDGRMTKVLAYDRAVNYLEIQKHFALGGRWYPES